MRLLFPFLLFVLLFADVPGLHAQTYKWAHAILNNPGYGYKEPVIIDHQHDVITVNQYSDSLSVGTTTLHATNGNTSSCLIKYDSSGNVLWAVNIPVTNAYKAIQRETIAVDKENNIYVGGSVTNNVIYFTPTDSVVYSTHYGSFVAKYDPAGKFKWVIPVDGDMTCTAITVDNFDNVIWAGVYGSDPVVLSGKILPTSGAYLNYLLTKFTTDGKMIWARSGRSLSTISGTGFFSGITTDDTGSIYVTGAVPGNVVFGTKSIVDTSSLAFNTVIAGFDSSGTLQWGHAVYIDNDYSQGNGICLSKKKVIYICGYCDRSSIKGKPFVAKYTANGLLIWQKKFDGPSPSGATGIQLDAKGYPYVYGDYYLGIVFDTLKLSSKANGIFVTMLDTNGHIIWVKTEKGNSYASNMAMDNSTNNIAITGSFTDADTFGTVSINASHLTYSGAFVAYLSIPRNNVAVPEVTGVVGCTIYPNPATNTLYLKNAVPNSVVNIYNVNGQAVYFGKLNTTQQAINISGLVSGMYFVKMITPDGVVQTKTFVKE